MSTPKPTPKPLPSIESLRCFFAAAQHLNFRRAASEVGLTATAFSERIRSLERELGATLFTRTTRRVELTQAGRALEPAAERALSTVQACLSALKEPGQVPVRLRLGTRFELGLSWLLPAVIELERSRPSWQIDLYFGSGPDILERLERGTLDAALTSAPVAHASWHAQVLHPEGYSFVGSSRLITDLPLRAPRDAQRHTLLDVDETLPLARYLLSVAPTLEFQRVRLCGAGAAVLKRVLAGDGVAVLPSHMLIAALRDRRLVRLLPKVRLLSDTFRLVYRKNSHQSSALSELASFLLQRPLS
jgi:DNA-binding transcriptional LysR family regulator